MASATSCSLWFFERLLLRTGQAVGLAGQHVGMTDADLAVFEGAEGFGHLLHRLTPLGGLGRLPVARPAFEAAPLASPRWPCCCSRVERAVSLANTAVSHDWTVPTSAPIASTCSAGMPAIWSSSCRNRAAIATGSPASTVITPPSSMVSAIRAAFSHGPSNQGLTEEPRRPPPRTSRSLTSEGNVRSIVAGRRHAHNPETEETRKGASNLPGSAPSGRPRWQTLPHDRSVAAPAREPPASLRISADQWRLEADEIRRRASSCGITTTTPTTCSWCCPGGQMSLGRGRALGRALSFATSVELFHMPNRGRFLASPPPSDQGTRSRGAIESRGWGPPASREECRHSRSSCHRRGVEAGRRPTGGSHE